MARMGRGGWIDGAIVILAIAARVAAVLVLRSYEVPHSTYEHGEIAANLLAGRGFSKPFLGADGPTSQQAPIYPALVALAYVAGGVETPRALLYLELGQSLLGGLLVWEVMRLARRIAPDRHCLARGAALASALHPTLIYAATHVQVASIGALLLVGTLARAYQTGQTGRRRDAWKTGGWLGLLALTDPILSLAAIGAALAVRLGPNDRTDAGDAGAGSAGNEARPGWRSFRLIAEMLAAALVVVAPWLARNFVVHGEFVAIKSTFGYAFWQGNCALSEGTDKVLRASVDRILERGRSSTSLSEWNRSLWAARHEAGYLDDVALSHADYARLGAVSEPERSRILFRRALADLRAGPWRYPRLCLRRLRYFFLFDETNPKTRVWAYRLPHLALTGFALLGLACALPRRDARRRLVPTLATAAAIALFHALTIVSARFHVPIEPLMALWGAAALSRGDLSATRKAAPTTRGRWSPNHQSQAALPNDQPRPAPGCPLRPERDRDKLNPERVGHLS